MAIFGHKDDVKLSPVTVGYQIDTTSPHEITWFYLRITKISYKEVVRRKHLFYFENYAKYCLELEYEESEIEDNDIIFVMSSLIFFCRLCRSVMDNAYYKKEISGKDLFFLDSRLRELPGTSDIIRDVLRNKTWSLISLGSDISMLESAVNEYGKIGARECYLHLNSVVESIINAAHEAFYKYTNRKDDKQNEDFEANLLLPFGLCQECKSIFVLEPRRRQEYCSYRCAHRVKARADYAALFPEGKRLKKSSEEGTEGGS